MPHITLRPATHADRAFLRRVYATTREEELRGVPWTPEQKAAFVDMQFGAQDRHYREHYSGAQFLVVEAGGRPLGRLYLHSQPDEVRLMDLTLLPEFRGQGVGTALVGRVLARAAGEGKAVRLHVEGFNPALRLYERLGFVPLEERGVYRFMEWRAPAVR